MPTKLNGNPETSWKLIIYSQNHIAISNIFQGSPDFCASDGSDVLGTGSLPCVSVDVQRLPAF
jgi:hypothetical protein